jgi:hypothetical protein
VVANVSVLEIHGSSLTLSIDYTGKGQSVVMFITVIKDIAGQQNEEIQPQENQVKDKCCNQLTRYRDLILCKRKRNYTINNLAAGTLYNISIFSCIDGLLSTQPHIFKQATSKFNIYMLFERNNVQQLRMISYLQSQTN